MDPAAILAAMELAMKLVQAGTEAYAEIKAAQEENDPVKLQAQFEKLVAINDALVS